MAAFDRFEAYLFFAVRTGFRFVYFVGEGDAGSFHQYRVKVVSERGVLWLMWIVHLVLTSTSFFDCIHQDQGISADLVILSQ